MTAWISPRGADARRSSAMSIDIGLAGPTETRSRPSLTQAVRDLCRELADQSVVARPGVGFSVRVVGALHGHAFNPPLRAVDELVSNALEHGFDAMDQGLIHVDVRFHSPSCCRVTVRDDGRGFGDAAWSDGNGFALLRLIGELQVGHRTAAASRGAMVTLFIGEAPVVRSVH